MTATKHMEMCSLHAVYFTLLKLCTKAHCYIVIVIIKREHKIQEKGKKGKKIQIVVYTHLILSCKYSELGYQELCKIIKEGQHGLVH